MSERPEQITIDDVAITIVRSAQRTKTVSLEKSSGAYVLRAPLAIDEGELHRLAARLLTRYTRRVHGRALNDDGALRRRADELNRRYFGGTPAPREVRYVTNQRQRYGSCTPATGVIRISDRVASLPDWVRDYIIVHELAHLHEPNHGPAFWRLVSRYELTERARGYLMALGLEEGAGPSDDDGIDGEGIV